MKTLALFIRGVFRPVPEKPHPQPTGQAKTAPQPAPVAQNGEHNAFAQDASPPGYKVRWHH